MKLNLAKMINDEGNHKFLCLRNSEIFLAKGIFKKRKKYKLSCHLTLWLKGFNFVLLFTD